MTHLGINEPIAREVLAFWFKEIDQNLHFKKDPDFDALIAARFGGLVSDLLANTQNRQDWGGALDHDQALAAILVLDQFPRNIYRDDPRAFAGDQAALALAQQLARENKIADWTSVRHRNFALMPFQHTEDAATLEAGLPLFDRYADESTADYARQHLVILHRFGRYPHRNTVLGRVSTADERAFIETPGSGF